MPRHELTSSNWLRPKAICDLVRARSASSQFKETSAGMNLRILAAPTAFASRLRSVPTRREGALPDKAPGIGTMARAVIDPAKKSPVTQFEGGPKS
jgi:hypothetical protein